MSTENTISVLIVDDHPILRSGLKQSLKELDYVTVVGEVGDGRLAVKEALRLYPNVILMDIGLPGIDGIEACWSIKKELPRTRIIMFTSRDSADDVTSALGVGADGYCLKHASTKRIASAIDSVVRGEIWLDPELAETAVHKIKKANREAISQELSTTENRVLELIAQDLEVSEIAEKLGLTPMDISALMRQMIIRHSKEVGSDSISESKATPNFGQNANTNPDFSGNAVPGRGEVTPGGSKKFSQGSGQGFSLDWFSATVDTSGGLILADKYLLQGLLGAGGIGVVFKAKHLYMDRTVAIKFLKPEFREEGRVARAFQQEAKSLATLKHRNIVDIYDFGVSTSNQPFLVMEFLDGSDLDFVFNRSSDRRLSIRKFLTIFLQACEALAAAHSHNVIHCDLKPSNILVRPRGPGLPDEVKIVDFGLAKMVPRDAGKQSQATDSYMVDGTPSYMPPEQCLGKTIDHRADIYSLGCVMYEALAGVNPFKADTPIATFAKQIEFVPPPISGFLAGVEVDESLAGCITRMLAKDPSERQQSVKDVLKVLYDIGENLARAKIQ